MEKQILILEKKILKKIYLDDAQIVDVRKEFIGSKTAPL